MILNVKHAEYKFGYKVYLVFNNGESAWSTWKIHY